MFLFKSALTKDIEKLFSDLLENGVDVICKRKAVKLLKSQKDTWVEGMPSLAMKGMSEGVKFHAGNALIEENVTRLFTDRGINIEDAKIIYANIAPIEEGNTKP